jgi:ABC-type transport system involved in cytochrome c biogenesis permease subunit
MKFVHGITILCFLASYSLALALELLALARPRRGLRLLAQVAGLAGIVAQTIFLGVQQPPLIWQYGWMLFLAWVLAIFYLVGSFHHRRQAWGVFVLPLVLGLVALGAAFGRPDSSEEGGDLVSLHDLWRPAHALLLFLAAVGVCVGFLASLMYLVQARRLRAKALPGKGVPLLNLERLEAMNRRAINLAFPLLTGGLIIGLFLMIEEHLRGWSDPRVLSAGVLWLAFAVLLYLRYGYHLRGRQVALWTIVTFGLLVCCLALSHPVGQGGGR